jgi:hypothetical protein
MIRRKKNSERGEGALVILLFVLGVAIAWLVVHGVINWIYDTKEARIEADKRRQMHEDPRKPQINPDDDREPGGYVVHF